MEIQCAYFPATQHSLQKIYIFDSFPSLLL